MAVSELLNGTQTTSGTTEHVVTTNPTLTDGVFQFFVDRNDMVLSDTLEVRLKEKVINGGTQRTIQTFAMTHAPTADDIMWVSPAIILIHGWDMTIKAATGTITLPWSVRQVGNATELTSGTQVTSGTTEHVVTTNPTLTDGMFQVLVDLADMVAADEVQFRIKEKCLSSGTQRNMWTWTLKNAQSADNIIWVSPAFTGIHGWDFSIKATVGTISLPWSVRKAGG